MIYKFYLKIHKWVVPSGGADVYQVSSYFHIVNNGANPTLYKIISIEINDKNTFIDDSILVSSGKGQNTIINQNETHYVDFREAPIIKIKLIQI